MPNWGYKIYLIQEFVQKFKMQAFAENQNWEQYSEHGRVKE